MCHVNNTRRTHTHTTHTHTQTHTHTLHIYIYIYIYYIEEEATEMAAKYLQNKKMCFY